MQKWIEHLLILSAVQWEATFPGAPEGELSAVFMKRVIFAFASDLLSRRRLLAATEFRKRQVEC